MLDALNWLSSSLNKSFGASQARQFSEARWKYAGMSDEELREECQKALEGYVPEESKTKLTLLSRLAFFILNLLMPMRASAVNLSILALSVEAFKRAPADLPRGSDLYLEQIHAARALTQPCLVQMDTGEGKTYAILPAAFALACTYDRTYIICASEYLAWRDANRTRSYWQLLGIQPGLGIKGTEEREWTSRIVYTTLENLIFKSLRDEISVTEPSYPISYGAVVLDEADAILLDQANIPYSIIHPVVAKAFDWNFALQYCDQLSEEEDVIVNRSDFTASLTVKAERRLQEQLQAMGWDKSQFLLLRYAVELAYVATKVAKEDVDYVVESERIYPIDRISGRVSRNVTPPWVIALEVAKGFEPRPKQITLHQRSPITFLGDFAHISGTSGTIAEESLAYLLIYCLFTVKIAARFPRHGEVADDQIFFSKAAAYRRTCKYILAAVEEGRPVLVGTQTIADAEQIYRMMQAQEGCSAVLRLLTGKDDRDTANFFEQSGQVGSVTIATQLAGRGVDIRLSDEAKQNSGMVLICVEHAFEARHDKQFLGRVGRQGDPFWAVFIVSYDDALFKALAADRIASLLQQFGLDLDSDEPLEHPIFTKLVRNAQEKVRYQQFLTRLSQAYLARTEAEISPSIKSWFEYVQLPAYAQDGRKLDDELAPDFIKRVCDHFVTCNLASLLVEGQEMDREGAHQVVSVIRGALALSPQSPIVESQDIEGYTGEVVARIVSKKLQESLLQACATNASLIRAYQEELSALWKQWKLSVACQDMIERIDTRIEAAGLALEEEAPGRLPRTPDDEMQIDALVESIDGVEDPAHRDFTSLVETYKSLVSGGADGAYVASASLEALRELRKGFNAVYQEAQSRLHDARLKWALAKRTTRHIAHWSLQWAWISFLEEKERILHRARQKGYSTFEFLRITTGRILQEWEKTEGMLSTQVLSHLLQAGTPEALHALFYLYDHRDTTDDESTSATYKWDPSGALDMGSPGLDRQQKVSELIQQFIAQSHTSLTSPFFTDASLTRLLDDFTRSNPLYMLNSPDRIQKALENWFALDIERGVKGSRRRFNRLWLQQFLLYLRQRHLIGALPTLRTRAKSLGGRLLKNLSELKTTVSVAGCLLFAATFILLAQFGNLVAPKDLGQLGVYVDAILFGGMLSEGVILAPAMGPLVLTLGFLYLLGPRFSGNLRGQSLDRYIAPVIHVVIAWWMVWGGNLHSFEVVSFLRNVGLFILILLLATGTQTIVNNIYNEGSIDLLSPWLCYCILGQFLPSVHLAGFPLLPLVIVFCVLAALFLSQEYWNEQELPLVSAHIRDPAALGESEEISTYVRVKGSVGYPAHLLGLLLSWSFYECLLVVVPPAGRETLSVGQAGDIVLVGIYLLVVTGWTAVTLKRRLLPSLWSAQLNARRQILRDAHDQQSFELGLARIKRLLLYREIAFQVLLVSAASVFLWGQKLPGTRFSLALVLVAMACVLSVELRSFVQQLYTLLVSRVPIRQEVLDLSTLPEPEEEMSFLQKVQKAFRNRIALSLTLLAILISSIRMLLELFKLWASME